ncbi:MAG: ABC transporter permease [Planctomycetaceae bacterium]
MSPPRPGDHTGPHGAGHAKESSIAPDPRSGGSLPLPGAALPPPSPAPARNTVCQPEINASAAPTPAAPTPGPATPGAPTPPNQPRAFLELEEITRTYTLGELRVPVLKGVSLRIERGEYVALMGSSGSGKTTLMNILGCLDRPTSGNYFLLEREVGQASSDARAAIRNGQLGFVFQSFHLLPRTSALDNVQLPFEYARTHPGDAAEREAATRLLERVGLGERLDHEPAQMSGGQQQRVAIARALVHSPPLLLADEPTGNLDSRTGLEILDLFDRLHAEGVTIVLVTHDSEVGARAGRVIRLRDGLVESDTINLQRRQPAATGSSPHSQPAVPGPTDSNSPTLESAAPPPLATVTANRLPSPGGQTAGPRHEGGPPPAQAVVPSAWFPLPRGLKTAARAILRNKLRSGLTMLGIVIGVAAVIAMMEIGRGSNDAIQKTIASMGANNLLVQPGAASSGGVTFGGGSGLTLTPRDALELSRQVPSLSNVAPIVRAHTQVIFQGRNWVPVYIYGSTPEFLDVRDWTNLAEGEMFGEREVRNGSAVCVVGQTIVRELFRGESPVGREIRLQNVGFRVVGVLSRKGANMTGVDQDDIVLAPWTTIKSRVSANALPNSNQSANVVADSSQRVNSLSQLYPGANRLYPVPSPIQQANTPQPVRFTNVDQILVKVNSAAEVPDAIQQIKSVLRETHRLRTGQSDDFNIRDMTEANKALTQTSEMMGSLLLSVALISLVVGGVGIMNIMLVSVTERTREIGLRMALGARSRQILLQFLTEAIVLCLTGGALGIALGRGGSILVREFLGWPTVIAPQAIAASVAVAVGVGVLFGFYPAYKASRLDPITALRYE